MICLSVQSLDTSRWDGKRILYLYLGRCESHRSPPLSPLITILVLCLITVLAWMGCVLGHLPTPYLALLVGRHRPFPSIPGIVNSETPHTSSGSLEPGLTEGSVPSARSRSGAARPRWSRSQSVRGNSQSNCWVTSQVTLLCSVARSWTEFNPWTFYEHVIYKLSWTLCELTPAEGCRAQVLCVVFTLTPMVMHCWYTW